MSPPPSSGPNSRASPDGGSSGRESRPPAARSDDEHPGVVVPPETSEERRSRKRRRLLIGTLLAAVAVGGYYVWGGDVLERIGRIEGAMAGQAGSQIELLSDSSAERGNGEMASGDSSIDDSAAGSADSAPSGEAGPGTSVDPAVAAFRARVEELMTAASRFRERSHDFRLGRIDCSALAEGYVAVDRAMVDMAGSYLDAGARLAPEERDLYRRAMARADSTARIFDRSGCDRAF